MSNVPFKGPFGPAASRTVSEKVTSIAANRTTVHALERAMEAVMFIGDVPVKLIAPVNLYYKYDQLAID
ncbi:hypothetical protein ACJ8WG_005522 [Klebsiella pneumoniae]|uniref:hypothetical protein n=1 Tax=Klebsiella TaxID=570 RepID=UPI0013E94269|nr:MULTISPECIES: hypothetical protein [Klebsiella]EJR0359916.1 hypothetical protein [Klebsiella quasipneumoniae]EKV4334192.1 hypothetical protein [Klebsiella quasipneumoniae]EKY1774911.1 hypothetical protein [Klebsiella pneumoniae]MCG5574661.1 hypothetical protein [Klebsiella pneumoniae]MCJ4418279.1 hypothetical protein [Klebsiella pneumoniae]